MSFNVTVMGILCAPIVPITYYVIYRQEIKELGYKLFTGREIFLFCVFYAILLCLSSVLIFGGGDSSSNPGAGLMVTIRSIGLVAICDNIFARLAVIHKISKVRNVTEIKLLDVGIKDPGGRRLLISNVMLVSAIIVAIFHSIIIK